MVGETPKLWSKLEAAGDVTTPQLGTGGAEIGSPTYEAAKFNFRSTNLSEFGKEMDH